MSINKEYSQDKIFLHMDKVGEFVGGKDVTPVVMETNITNKCNANCIWCSERSYRDRFAGASIGRTAMLDAIEGMASAGVRSIVFEGGGEPTVHPDFNEFVDAAVKNGLSVGLITNGMRLREAGVVESAHRYSFIRISFDAGAPSVYSKLHGVPERHFEDILSAVKELTANVRHNQQDSDLRTIVGMSFIVTEDNLPTAREFARRAKEAGVAYVQFKAEIFENSFRIPFQALEQITAVQEEFQDDSFRVFIVRLDGSACSGKKDYQYCYAHRFIGAITANGEVQLCCNLKHNYGDSFSFGNLHSTSFKEIWEGVKRKAIIGQVEGDPSFVSVHCGQCRMDNINRLFNWMHEYDSSPTKNFI